MKNTVLFCLSDDVEFRKPIVDLGPEDVLQMPQDTADQLKITPKAFKFQIEAGTIFICRPP